MDGGRFTEEELSIAKSVDLTAVATNLGYTVKRVGRYHTLKEMDSVRIYDKVIGFDGQGSMKKEAMVVLRLISFEFFLEWK